MAQEKENQALVDPGLNSGSGLDSELLNRRHEKKNGRKESADRAGALKEKKREKQVPSGSPIKSLREMVKGKRAEKNKKEGGSDSDSAAPSSMRKGTSKLLQEAWINLISSWGLTLIWINIHVFLGTVFGNKFFVKLGGEWVDGNEAVQVGKIAAGAAGQKGDKALDKVKKAEQTAGKFEGMGLACLDLGCLLLTIFILANLAFLLGIITNPFGTVIQGAIYVWDAVKQIIFEK